MRSGAKWILILMTVIFYGCTATNTLKSSLETEFETIMPTIVQIEADENSQLTITWEVSESQARRINGFEIFIKPPGEDVFLPDPIEIRSSKRSVDISGILDSGLGSYYFMIRANDTDFVSGPLSNPFLFIYTSFKSSSNFWGGSSNIDTTFSSPEGIYVSPEGYVFVSDTGNSRIVKLDESGNVLGTYGKEGEGAKEFFSPKGLTMDSEGNIIVADSDNDRIVRFDPDNFETTFETLGSFGSKIGDFKNPIDVLVLEDDSVLVTDANNMRIQKISFTSTSNWINPSYTEWASSNVLIGPWKMAKANSKIVVVDKATSKILIFDLNGNLELSWGSMTDPTGIDYSANDGYVYISDNTEDAIHVYDITGTFISKWGLSGEDRDEFDEPSDIAISGSKIYVSESGNNRIQVFE